MSKERIVKLELTPIDANALMVMIESEIETTFTYGDIDPINEWEEIHLYEPQNYSQINRWGRRVVELSEEILTEELEQEFQGLLTEGQEHTQDG